MSILSTIDVSSSSAEDDWIFVILAVVVWLGEPIAEWKKGNYKKATCLIIKFLRSCSLDFASEYLAAHWWYACAVGFGCLFVVVDYAFAKFEAPVGTMLVWNKSKLKWFFYLGSQLFGYIVVNKINHFLLKWFGFDIAKFSSVISDAMINSVLFLLDTETAQHCLQYIAEHVSPDLKQILKPIFKLAKFKSLYEYVENTTAEAENLVDESNGTVVQENSEPITSTTGRGNVHTNGRTH